MDNSAIAHLHMVTNQILPNRVSDVRLIQALQQIPRHEFVPDSLRGIAYIDEDLPMGNGRYMLEPVTFARIVEAAGVTAEDSVLDIACATGYSAAILSQLSKKVVAVECDADMASVAHRRMKRLEIKNVIVIDGNLVEGHPEEGPYNVIVVEGGILDVPEILFEQLAEGGRLVTVIQPNDGVGAAVLFEKHGGIVSHRKLFEATVTLLPGFDRADVGTCVQ